MGPTTLPGVIERYQRAHDAGDTSAALAAFTASAVVVDDGHTARGHDEIRDWLSRSSSEFTWTRTLIEASSTGPGKWLIAQNLVGDFPGGTVDLRYEFTLDDELITAP